MSKTQQRIKKFHNRIKSMPAVPRRIVGVLLLIGGVLGFFPILGFWMIPLGLLVLSVDFRWARRGYLSVISWLRKWRDRNKSKKPVNTP